MMTTSNTQPLPQGTSLGRGKYVIETVVGQGGFGYVYRARNQQGQPLAIKQCIDLSSEGLMQFGHEVAVQKILQDTTFVRVYAQFVEVVALASAQAAGESLFTVMEFVPGRSFDELLTERLQQHQGPFAEYDAVAWTMQLLGALQHAHDMGVIHRDIKPSNILLLPDGRNIKVIDFGIAKIGGTGAQTLRGARGVSPGYSPPEQYAQTGQTDTFSDIYAVGATLYHLLTGHAPVDAPVRQSGQMLIPPRRHNPVISPMIEDVILQAMQLNVADRYQRAVDMLAALQGKQAALAVRACSICHGALLGADQYCSNCGSAAQAVPSALSSGKSLQGLTLAEFLRWCDSHWVEAIRILRSGELVTTIQHLRRPARTLFKQADERVTGVVIDQVRQASALADDNLALETALRALGAKPPRFSHNWREIERRLGMGWRPDGRWLWPWWSGPKQLTFVIQNKGRGYLHGRVDAAVHWLEIAQPEFGCLPGQKQTVQIGLEKRQRRLKGLAPELLVLQVN